MGKKKTHEEYVNELAIKNPFVKVVDLYVDAKTPIKHYCERHNKFWDISPCSALKGTGCSECGKEKIGAKHRKTHESYVAEVSAVNPNIIVVGRYQNAHTPIKHYCIEHDIIWDALPTNILRGHGCCICGNNTKKTQEQYVNEVANINPLIEVIGTYINARTPVLHRCKVDGHIWPAVPYVILRGDGCPKCAGNAKRTTEEYINELARINLNIEVLEEYINSTTPILHRCKIDNHIWPLAPYNALLGRGCPVCKSVKLSNIFVKTHEQYVQELKEANPDLEVLEQYINARTPILHRCTKDGYTWKIAPSNVLIGQGCPQCQESYGERIVRQWLQRNSIVYVYQHTFNDCKDQKLLPFDFYLPKYNICIEYDGQQHFEPVDFAGKGEEWALQQLLKTQKHDTIKTQYCKDNNIFLLRIPYNKNVEEELENFLFI